MRSTFISTWLALLVFFALLSIFSFLQLSHERYFIDGLRYKGKKEEETSAGNNNNRDRDPFLPIVPRTSFSSLNAFFSNYTGDGGWIDVGVLSRLHASDIRQLAEKIMGRNIQCGYPRVNVSAVNIATTSGSSSNERTIIPPEDKPLEYCFWGQDLVSSEALNDFNFEKEIWEWVAKEFQRVTISHPSCVSIDKDCCERLAFLDIGVNVGDWISPIRLLAPETIPIYGVEGSPATAAIATANLQTSSEYHGYNKKTCSKLLPFTMAPKAQIPHIRRDGGICFSNERYQKVNVGGRRVDGNKKMNQCKESADVAGATTLEHAIESLCPNNTLPRVYILKIDIEGFELKAISSVISTWLARAPPCYFIMEVWQQYSYTALIEILLSVVGYDSVWRPFEGEFPTKTLPFLTGLTGTQEDMVQIMSSFGHKTRYREFLFGFSDIDICIDNIMAD